MSHRTQYEHLYTSQWCYPGRSATNACAPLRVIKYDIIIILICCHLQHTFIVHRTMWFSRRRRCYKINGGVYVYARAMYTLILHCRRYRTKWHNRKIRETRRVSITHYKLFTRAADVEILTIARAVASSSSSSAFRFAHNYIGTHLL